MGRHLPAELMWLRKISGYSQILPPNDGSTALVCSFLQDGVCQQLKRIFRDIAPFSLFRVLYCLCIVLSMHA
jgi:hypothetical protein